MNLLLRICFIVTIVGLLAACVSVSPMAPPAESNSSSTRPEFRSTNEEPHGMLKLPHDYKRMAAIRLVSEYIDDANGPPEISEPITSVRLLGTITQAMIRYPVSASVAARRNFMARFNDGTYYRCGSISALSGVSTLGGTQVTVGTAKLDQPECNPSLKFSRYRELEDLAAQCRDPNRPCEIVKRTPLGGTLINGQ